MEILSSLLGPLWEESTGHFWISEKGPAIRGFDGFFVVITSCWTNSLVAGDTPWLSCHVTAIVFLPSHEK